MDSSCQLINSMYNQYIKILNDYENQKQVIQRQILYSSMDTLIIELQNRVFLDL
mgnify:CR=1 FL=1